VKDSLADYRARTLRFQDTAWGRDHYRFHVAQDDAGELVAACKVYRLDLAFDQGEGHGIGFGAVFTRTDKRGLGHASRMLTQIEDAARADGALVALLFSDIGPESDVDRVCPPQCSSVHVTVITPPSWIVCHDALSPCCARDSVSAAQTAPSRAYLYFITPPDFVGIVAIVSFKICGGFSLNAAIA
jgi:hypothetical protein